MKKPKLTADALGLLLFEEFDREAWGDLDPFYLNPENRDDDGEDPSAVLERVVKRLREEFTL